MQINWRDCALFVLNYATASFFVDSPFPIHELMYELNRSYCLHLKKGVKALGQSITILKFAIGLMTSVDVMTKFRYRSTLGWNQLQQNWALLKRRSSRPFWSYNLQQWGLSVNSVFLFISRTGLHNWTTIGLEYLYRKIATERCYLL